MSARPTAVSPPLARGGRGSGEMVCRVPDCTQTRRHSDGETRSGFGGAAAALRRRRLTRQPRVPRVGVHNMTINPERVAHERPPVIAVGNYKRRNHDPLFDGLHRRGSTRFSVEPFQGSHAVLTPQPRVQLSPNPGLASETLSAFRPVTRASAKSLESMGIFEKSRGIFGASMGDANGIYGHFWSPCRALWSAATRRRFRIYRKSHSAANPPSQGCGGEKSVLKSKIPNP